jgi:serine/threonine-protein kinase
MPWQEAVPLALDLLDALGAMHRSGVVHRDVKPANVLVTEHQGPVLVDLGFAQLEDAGPRLTPDGRVVGTPGFIPPEVLMGRRPAGPSADVYAMGVMMFQMLVGQLPFSGALSEMIVSIMSGPRPSLTALVPDLPPTIAAIVDRAMARDPRARFQDADGMAWTTREALGKLATEQL